MKDILFMVLLGMIGGSISCFWTRIIRPGMIFSFVCKWLTKRDNSKIIATGTGSVLSKFLCCVFCLSPWIIFLLEFWYVITYHPSFWCAVIGVLGALGAGNLVAEIVYALRGRI